MASDRNRRRDRGVKHPLDHPKRALVFTQIYVSAGPITAKEISKNTGLPLNTVYNHLGELSEESIIVPKTEKVGNLILERWSINPDYDRERRNQIPTIVNERHEDRFMTDPVDLARQLTMLNSFAIPYVKSYEENREEFIRIQQQSSAPAIVKIWTLLPGEFEYAVREIERIRKRLRKSDKALRDQLGIPSFHLPLENEDNLVFMVALPRLNDQQKAPIAKTKTNR